MAVARPSQQRVRENPFSGIDRGCTGSVALNPLMPVSGVVLKSECLLDRCRGRVDEVAMTPVLSQGYSGGLAIGCLSTERDDQTQRGDPRDDHARAPWIRLFHRIRARSHAGLIAGQTASA